MKPRIVALAVVAATHAAIADPSPDPAELFREGQAAYAQQNYDDAVALWEQSYSISRAPALLYNLGQAHRLRGHAGDCAAARTDYERFIELTSPSPERELATGYIAALATCAGPTTVEPRPAPAPVAPAPPNAFVSPSVLAPSQPASTPTRAVPGPSHGRVVGGVVVGVAGIGLLASGIALLHHASVLGDDVAQACSASCDWAAEKERDSTGRRDTALGRTFTGVGAAALVGSAVLVYFGVREHGVIVAPVGAASGAALVWRGTW